MNIYRCVSENLTEPTSRWSMSNGPYDPYYIVELVAAETPSQAKWAAWKTDKNFDGDIHDMPKFSVVLTRKGVSAPKGIIEKPKSAWWSSHKELCEMWRTRIAVRRERRLGEAL